MIFTHVQLREKYLNFWKNNNHKEVPAIPLIPQNDPTTLFTGSGMQQLVPYLLGETHPQGKRLYNIQPCFRSQDIDEVGDNRHTTFFEMMGNWSLGDYFKKEQLTWFWNFLIEEIKLPKEKLYVTLFNGDKKNNLPPDNESYEIWKKLGISESNIFKYDGNWWSRAGSPSQMPEGEPGGPDSEVFYEFTEVPHNEKFGKTCHPNCECGRFLEIGNSVFMEYKKTDQGFKELPKKNVDFGGGLERILAALNDNPDVFKTDIYVPIITAIEKITNKKYEGNNQQYLRIIADHIKASSFLIINGVMPSNKEQGYVLRRMLRRAAVKTYELSGELSLENLVKVAEDGVFKTYNQTNYFSHKNKVDVLSTISEEMNRFEKSLAKGMHEIKKQKNIDGKFAFFLYQSYGFPWELTEEIAIENGAKIDKQLFIDEFEKHKTLSRSTSVNKFKGGLADQSEQTIKYHTATHLLHQALFDVIGDDIRQEGSNITSERLRFDFYSIKKPSEVNIKKVEDIVNEKINQKLAVESKIIPKEEAIKLGAKAFFRQKYPNTVKVYFIAGYSKEFCGGPHVKNTSEIGVIKIFRFEKIGSNLYRIYAK